MPLSPFVSDKKFVYALGHVDRVRKESRERENESG